MDRQLKARLVGAAILVTLVVIVVPEMLSGPTRSTATSSADGTRHVLIDLDSHRTTASVAPLEPRAAGADALPPPAPAGDAAPTGPAPPSAAEARSESPTGGAGAASHPATALENPPQAPISKTLESSPRAHWSVQLGSFASRANAERLVRQLKASGEEAYVLSSGSGAQQRYRVRIGPLADRGSAERTVARLKSQGHAATAVAPDARG